MEQFRIDGKIAVITGGGSGIGLGIAEVLVKAGGRVVIVGRDEVKLKEAKLRLGEQAVYRVFDVTDKEAIPAFVAEIEQNVGPIEILVNGAGVHLKKPALDVSDNDYLRVLDVHLLSVFALTREVMRYMVERRSGSLIPKFMQISERKSNKRKMKALIFSFIGNFAVSWLFHNNP